MSFFNVLKETILWIWQLPQNLLGLGLLAYYQLTKGDVEKYAEPDGRYFYSTKGMPSGVCLGNYIIMKYKETGNDMKHEFGHSIQSRILGPLYLLLIGLPSLCGNIYDQVFHTYERGWNYWESVKRYYNQPWEKWADKLGGVVRFYV
jgi:hypothetical protein